MRAPLEYAGNLAILLGRLLVDRNLCHTTCQQLPAPQGCPGREGPPGPGGSARPSTSALQRHQSLMTITAAPGPCHDGRCDRRPLQRRHPAPSARSPRRSCPEQRQPVISGWALNWSNSPRSRPPTVTTHCWPRWNAPLGSSGGAPSTSARFFSPAPACLDHAPQGSRCRWTLPLHRSGAYSAPSRTLIQLKRAGYCGGSEVTGGADAPRNEVPTGAA